MVEDVPAFTPVTLLTGFLGSGKTTLLRRLLADPAFGDTAVIINELGEIGIDHLLVERLDDQMVLLKSGCVCCTVRGELATAMRDLHSRRERGACAAVPAAGDRKHRARRSVSGAFDAQGRSRACATIFAAPASSPPWTRSTASLQLERHIELVRQVAIADVIVLTKTDLAEAAVTARLAARSLAP